MVDTFHIWWDAELASQIARAGAEGRIATYQVCDWKTPLAADALLSRGYPGDGRHRLRGLHADGDGGRLEPATSRCELFNQDIWNAPYDEVARTARERYARLVEPFAG